jgi:hypothetical protein
MKTDLSDAFGERIARVVFYFLIVVLLYPVFSLDFIVSHDGPSHIYNSVIIRQLLYGREIADYFLNLKLFPEPNWIGHFILIILQYFVSPQVADKIFIGAYILFFPLFFRALLNKINPESTILAFFAFPFIYSLFLFLGVYNFLAGITILIYALSNVIPKIGTGENIFRRVLIFSLLLYFSHLLALGVFIITLFVALLFSIYDNENMRKIFLRQVRSISIALSPVLILSLFFFLGVNSVPAKFSNVTFKEMIDFLWHIRFIITLTYSPEDIYALIIFGLIAFLLLWWIIKKIISKENRILPFYQRFPFWLTCALIMLSCYFFIPDEAASGGVVKFRFLFIFYLFLIAFLSVVKFPTIVNSLVIITISCWTVMKLNYLYPFMRELNNEATELMHVTKKVTPNSILLPLNYSNNWIHDNLSNYAGLRDNIFVLDNYEANTPHFPVEWKEERNPIQIMGEFTGYVPLCANMEKFEKVTGKNIDYVLVWRPQQLNDSCSNSINAYLAGHYSLITDEAGARLYRRN